jgi:hypothetical protein
LSFVVFLKRDSRLLDVLHKDELQSKPLTIFASSVMPSSAFNLIIRPFSGSTFKLIVDPETTIRECKHQVKCLGSSLHEQTRWMFAGSLLSCGRTLGFYQITSLAALDVIARACFSTPFSLMIDINSLCSTGMEETCPLKKLQMRDPIAVDGLKPVGKTLNSLVIN